MAHQPMHSPLSAHNARVLRLARDYDKKYRPVLIPIAKHMNLETGQSFPGVATIMRESARYTDKRKPLSRSQVFKLLAEMTAAGAIKTEARHGPTGRQRSSIRYLDIHVAIRFGKPVEHLWDAPVAEDKTPDETPRKTPDETPITLSISLDNSPSNSVKTRERGASPSREIEGGPGKDSPGICNTFIAWEVGKKGSGKLVAFRKDNPPRQKPPKHARIVELTPAEASFMFRCLDKDQMPGFILEKPWPRSVWMRTYGDRDVRDRAERDSRPDAVSLAEREEAKRVAERAEREPLVQRWAELLGEDVDTVRQRVDRQTCGRDAILTWLKFKVYQAEEQARARAGTEKT
jgi:hypothetical protein